MTNHIEVIMDAAVTTLLNTAKETLAAQDQHNTAERDLFEQFMFETFLNYKLDETKMYYLRRDPNHHDRYEQPQMENMWWVWKSRAAIARGEQAEAYPI